MCLYGYTFCLGCGTTLTVPVPLSRCATFSACYGCQSRNGSLIRRDPATTLCATCAAPPPPPGPQLVVRVDAMGNRSVYLASAEPQLRPNGNSQ